MKINKKAFTLVELLVVVLIIGILAAIAVPQYQKAVLKADLHRGIPLVESLYQAQQSYALTHGDFATDIDDLDLTIPKDESCDKTQTASSSYYYCDFGAIGMWDKFTNIQFQNKNMNSTIAYLHAFKDYVRNGNILYHADKKYCFALPNNKAAIAVCESLGGTLSNEGYWKEYIIN